MKKEDSLDSDETWDKMEISTDQSNSIISNLNIFQSSHSLSISYLKELCCTHGGLYLFIPFILVKLFILFSFLGFFFPGSIMIPQNFQRYFMFTNFINYLIILLNSFFIYLDLITFEV